MLRAGRRNRPPRTHGHACAHTHTTVAQEAGVREPTCPACIAARRACSAASPTKAPALFAPLSSPLPAPFPWPFAPPACAVWLARRRPPPDLLLGGFAARPPAVAPPPVAWAAALTCLACAAACDDAAVCSAKLEFSSPCHARFSGGESGMSKSLSPPVVAGSECPMPAALSSMASVSRPSPKRSFKNMDSESAFSMPSSMVGCGLLFRHAGEFYLRGADIHVSERGRHTPNGADASAKSLVQ